MRYWHATGVWLLCKRLEPERSGDRPPQAARRAKAQPESKGDLLVARKPSAHPNHRISRRHLRKDEPTKMARLIRRPPPTHQILKIKERRRNPSPPHLFHRALRQRVFPNQSPTADSWDRAGITAVASNNSRGKQRRNLIAVRERPSQNLPVRWRVKVFPAECQKFSRKKSVTRWKIRCRQGEMTRSRHGGLLL